MRKLPALLLLSAVAVAATARDTPPSQATPKQRVTYAYHSAFLMNLHHFLYDMAVNKDKLAKVVWHSAPDEQDMAAVRDAITFYRTHYASLGLRDDPALVAIKRALSVDDARSDVHGLGLPANLEAVLSSVAPAYARRLWPLHERSNRDWIAQASKLDAAYGAQIQAGIERHLGAAFPATPIRDDVVFDTGTRQGAYTDEQMVMPSSRPSYQGLASLEMLYHEASHTTVTAALEAALEARLKATGRNTDSDLWHLTQFYTVGAVTRDVLARPGKLEYQPYADKRGLYSGYWAPFMPVIEAAWVPHMQGKLDLQSAARQMVDRLPPEKSAPTSPW
ncbi:MAG TPA: hypothetical protein VGC21_09915 [Telluria sp.]|jgi:hypothetical protein